MNTFVLKSNSEEIRRKISDTGIIVCRCTCFYGARWLVYHESVGDVHGIGYDSMEMTGDETIALFLYEEEKDITWCKDVDEFIANILGSIENSTKNAV